MKITVIIGLPCSGKSYYAKTLNGYIIDDYSYNHKNFYPIEDAIKINKDIIIVDCVLCNPLTRSLAETILNGYGVPVEWIFFENNINKCLVNMRYRQSQGDCRDVETDIRSLAKIYKIPDNIKPLLIWQPK